MAIVTKVIDTGGTGDYSSLSSWEAWADDQGSSGDQYIAQCRATGDAADNTQCTIAGWQTGVKCKIVPYSGEEHGGVWSDTKYRLYRTNDWMENGILFINKSGETHVEGIQIGVAAQHCNGVAVSCPGTDSNDQVIIRNNILKTTGTGDASYPLMEFVYKDYAHTYILEGNLLISTYYAIGANIANVQKLAIYNNTFVGGSLVSLYGAMTGTIWRNNHAELAGNWCSTGTPTTGNFSYNKTAHTGFGWDISGYTGCGVSAAVTFVDEGGADYHLASGDTALKDAGTSLSGNPDSLTTACAPTGTDIDGVVRTGTWDIGCDEYVGGGATLGKPKLMHYYRSLRH